jgi:hypothetical protein
MTPRPVGDLHADGQDTFRRRLPGKRSLPVRTVVIALPDLVKNREKSDKKSRSRPELGSLLSSFILQSQPP